MKLALTLHRHLRWFNLPTISLLALLQRTPVVRVAVFAEEFVASSPLGSVLKSVLATVASLGAVNSLAGATVVQASPASPANLTVGTSAQIVFNSVGTQTDPDSWSTTGSTPPGMSFSGTFGPLILSGIPSAAGTYNFSVTGNSSFSPGSVGPLAYTVIVTGGAPSFTTQPQGQTVTAGATVTFTAAASGTPTPTFQWKKGTVNISGATSASLTLNNVQSSDAANYTVVATNSVSSVTSNIAVLTVNAAPPSGFYLVGKSQNYLQTASTGSVADGFEFTSEAAGFYNLKFPNSSTVALVLNSGDSTYKYRQRYSAKAGLDAAFPTGTYQFTNTGFTTLSFDLTTEAYPTALPSVTLVNGVAGTWTNGVLVLDPAVSNTITVSTNSTFATLGTAGHMQITVEDNNGVTKAQNEVVSRAAFGITVSATPITTLTIPASTLTAGKLYQGQVDFDTITTLDTTSISGGGAVALWTRGLRFYIGASATVTAPTIATQPVSRTGIVGGSAKFVSTINVSGAAVNNTSTDWLFNGQQIDVHGVKYAVDFSTGTLTINTLTSADFGSYSLRAVNSGGLVISNAAALTQATNYLSNLSVRATGDTTKPLILGFVVDGGAKPMLIRAAGPTLTTLGFGLTGALDPSLRLFNSAQAQVGLNDDWGTVTPSLVTTFNALGAFAFVNASKDSALLQTISGAHTAQASVTNSGTILVEAYDAGAADYRTLVNLSARFTVGTDDNILIAGFFLAGTGTRQLLIRAIGPKLGDYGVPGVLANPQLGIFDGATQILTNDDWVTVTPALAPTFNTLGAFVLTPTSGLPTNDTKSAALLVTLTAGKSYTAQVSGVGRTTGEALVEIYAVP